MELLVDPVVLALPPLSVDKEHCVRFAQQLELWNDTIRRSQHEFFVSWACANVLYGNGQYTDVHSLRRRLMAADVFEFDANTLFTACQHILMNMPYFEDRVPSCKDVAVDGNDVSINPDLAQRLEPEVATALRETLGYLAHAREMVKHPYATDMLMLTHPIPSEGTGVIEAIIFTDEGQAEVNAKVPLVEQPDDLVRMAGLPAIWQDTNQAINWAIQELVRKRALTEPVQVASYSVGVEFNTSIQTYRFDTQPGRLVAIYTEIAKFLTGITTTQGSVEDHDLRNVTCNRVDANGCEWEPRRMHLTGRPSSIRLHYWKYRGQYILSRVVPHEDYAIGPVPR